MKKNDSEKRSFVKRLIFKVCTLSLIVMIGLLNSCDKELEIKTDFPFELEVMPVPKSIAKGETVTIRCTIKAEGNYEGVKYKIRYFQFDGIGKLILSGKILKPNDLFSLPQKEFTLYYISESKVTQSFDISISDNKGNEQKMGFQFNNKDN
ncbi:DUF3872 domain-containing protein [Pedobacter sp. ISL-68]|uniref:DUF3872 domain-containing protein n=1 Tax=unclassified Pedobacter TaxID=2628915 RepID=UPI001BE996F5|nr:MULTISPECIES: DUF3872 domain-containing protein [unclassified Pedobacter]MBT2559823.1 DUF3872 domain-containing protein [Pedobacter sp. ISL-64]MBT2592128.1 DUF3872 domain-containing protein [Pedobacter sp. ISL-68]